MPTQNVLLALTILVIPAIGSWAADYSDAAILNSNAALDTSSYDGNVDLAADGKGVWVAVWESTYNLNGTAGTDYDILFARSTDNGITWSDPSLLNTKGIIDGDSQDGGPRIVTDGNGKWIVVWESNFNLGGTAGTDGDLMYSVSTDSGQNWSAQAFFNQDANTDLDKVDGGVEIATDSQGVWIANWIESGETIDLKSKVVYSRSSDNGVTWSLPEIVNTAIVRTMDGMNTLATDKDGNWVFAWVSSLDVAEFGTDDDILVATSNDNGLNWSTPGFLDVNSIADEGIRDQSPEITTDTYGNWVIVWEVDGFLDGDAILDRDIGVSRSSDNGANWSTPTLINGGYIDDNSLDSNPDVLTDDDGNFIVVWESTFPLNETAGSDRDILIAKSIDGGEQWTNPELLNSYGNSDNGGFQGSGGAGDLHPRISTDNIGNWVAVWDSIYDANTSERADRNIYYSIFSFELPDQLAPNAIAINAAVTEIFSGESVSLMVEFDEPVQFFDDASDLVIQHLGTSSINAVITGGPVIYAIDVIGIDGQGSFTVSVSTDSNVQDLAGNALASSVLSPVITVNPSPMEGEGLVEGVADGGGEVTIEGVSEATIEGVVEGEGGGEGIPEGIIEGVIEGISEGIIEGEGALEGILEGEIPVFHAADTNNSGRISLGELLRVIQFYNAEAISCVSGSGETEDGYQTFSGDESCARHNSDYQPPEWEITLSELLRLVQIYNSGGYARCEGGEDSFCPFAN